MSKLFSKIVSIIICLSLIFCVTGCGKKDDKQPDREKEKTIKFLHIWPEHSKVITKITNDFMAENKDVRVQILTSDYSNIGTTINTQILSQNLPDIFFYWAYGAQGYANNKVVLDLTPYLSGWKESFINNGDISWGSAKVGDGYYAMPWRQTANIMIYNKDMFEQEGWTIPTTYQEFEELLIKIRAYNTSARFSPIATSTVNGGNMLQFYYMLMNFSTLMQETYKDANYKNGLRKASITENEYSAKMLDKIKSFYDKGYLGEEGKSVETAVRNFMDGNSAMLYQNFNNVDVIGEVEFEWDYFAIPAPKGVDYRYIYDSYDSLYVAKTSKNVEACIRFLKYLSRSDVMEYFANQTNSIVPVSVTYEKEKNNSLSRILSTMGSPLLLQEDIKYSTGSIQDSLVEMYSKYIFGHSKMTSLEIVNKVDGLYENCIKDAGLQRVDSQKAFNTTLDYSWLKV